MPAVSKAQQRFMGMVHAVKKGEMAAPSPEVAKAASSMKKKDAKDFASTKHKGLPDKKEVEEAFRSSLLSDRKYMKKVSDEEKRNKEKDKRMKFGKFYDKAKDSAERLRPGEVKRWDPKLKKYISNKD